MEVKYNYLYADLIYIIQVVTGKELWTKIGITYGSRVVIGVCVVSTIMQCEQQR